MVLEAKISVDTTGDLIRGDKLHRSGQTLLQDAGRSTALLFLTLMSQRSSDLKWVPTTDVTPALTSAKMVCGTNGGNAAAWQAVSDGAFQITVDGILLDITGVDTSGITLLVEVQEKINEAADGRFFVLYDRGNDIFTFISPTLGLAGSSITVLTAGSSGTDISGTSFLNGLTTVGTVTAATGGNGTDIPAGIFWGNDVTAASLVAGDVTKKSLLVGKSAEIDESKIVLENSLDLDDIISSTGKTIRATLQDKGIYPRPTEFFQNIQPIA